MNKLTLILIGIFLISIVGAEIYSTPGFESISSEVSSDVFISTNLNESFEEDSTDNTFPYWLAFIIIVTAFAIYVQTKYLLKRKRERKIKAKGLVPNFVKGALDEMKNMEKPIEDLNVPEVEVVNKETKEEKFDNLINELGLEEVKDKIKGVDEDEQ